MRAIPLRREIDLRAGREPERFAVAQPAFRAANGGYVVGEGIRI